MLYRNKCYNISKDRWRFVHMQDKNVFEFVIYVIHACADKWK